MGVDDNDRNWEDWIASKARMTPSPREADEKATFDAERLVRSHLNMSRINGQQTTFMGKDISKLSGSEWRQLIEMVKVSPAILQPPNLTTHAADAAAYANAANKAIPSWDEMLRVRMRWPRLNAKGFVSVDVRIAGEKVFVWIITKDFKSVVLEDTADMFPSDQMVTQIRLLQG